MSYWATYSETLRKLQRSIIDLLALLQKNNLLDDSTHRSFTEVVANLEMHCIDLDEFDRRTNDDMEKW